MGCPPSPAPPAPNRGLRPFPPPLLSPRRLPVYGRDWLSVSRNAYMPNALLRFLLWLAAAVPRQLLPPPATALRSSWVRLGNAGQSASACGGQALLFTCRCARGLPPEGTVALGDAYSEHVILRFI
jgi:hypothetical protein